MKRILILLILFLNFAFSVSSDDEYIHKLNTNLVISKNKIPVISFLLEKTIIRINLLINLFIPPYKRHLENFCQYITPYYSVLKYYISSNT